MSGINKVILIGHVGSDPDLKKMPGDVSLLKLSLVTSETVTKNGVKVEQTDWHQITFWRALADAAYIGLKKGKMVHVECRLKARQFEDKDGVTRYMAEIVADKFALLGRNSDFDEAIEFSRVASYTKSS